MTEPQITEPARAERLAARFRALSTGAAGEVDRWLLVAGAVLAPLGIVLILLGYQGASRTPFGFEQTPYLISGGVLGLALVFIGGFVYFTYWQTRGVREAREHQREVLAALDRIAALLGDGASVADAAAPAARVTGFVATEKGSLYHLPDCPVAVRAKSLRTVKGTEAGLRPCTICNPAA